MKSIQELTQQEPVFLHNWSGKFDLISAFDDINMSEAEFKADKAPYANVEYWAREKNKMKERLPYWENRHILFASYGTDNYQGDAFVLFEQDGKLFEVNGSHRSCFGLEGQWSPEEASLEGIAHRLTEGKMGTDTYSDNAYADELKKFLGID